jgi:hypothetical protein
MGQGDVQPQSAELFVLIPPLKGPALPAEAFFGPRKEVKVVAKAGGMFNLRAFGFNSPFEGGWGHSRQPKESERGFTGKISTGKQILMLKFS